MFGKFEGKAKLEIREYRRTKIFCISFLGFGFGVCWGEVGGEN